MADGFNIPGVSDKYKTNDLVEALMNKERLPLEREKAQVETYTKQQDAWRGMNQKMTTLRDSVKTLYSFENPFNNKLSSSTQEDSVTAEAGRDAEFGSYKIDVLQTATTDRFMSGNIDKEMHIKEGKYTFIVGDKTVDFNWKGGKLQEFVNSLNKRGNNTVKASLIGVSANKKSLLIESLKTGEENKLIFENEALNLAKEIDMISPVTAKSIELKANSSTIKQTETKDTLFQENMPEISKNGVKFSGNEVQVPSRGGFELEIPENIRKDQNQRIEWTFTTKSTKDITESINDMNAQPVLPDAGSAEFSGIVIENNPINSLLPKVTKEFVPVVPVETEDENIFFVKTNDGNEIPLDSSFIKSQEKDGKQINTVQFTMKDFPDAKNIVVRNSNTGKEITLTLPQSYDSTKALGFKPNHAITEAGDAKIKYEGITITRTENDIDDVIPHLTLHLHEKTEKTATIKIEPDKESAKDAIITFVGKYNQVLAEMTILSTNKPEVISELDYLSRDEQDEAKERLGMFFSDNSLTTGKSQLQRIIANQYKYDEDSTIIQLAQIGVSTNAGGTGGYNPRQLRGYLEIDEKKLDSALENNLNDIKKIFGYDSDGDLIIDNGIAKKLDEQLTEWTRSGGLLSTKNSTLESRIKLSNQKITRLETQLDEKEAELRSKFSHMQGTVNSLENQQNSLNNFANQNQNRR